MTTEAYLLDCAFVYFVGACSGLVWAVRAPLSIRLVPPLCAALWVWAGTL